MIVMAIAIIINHRQYQAMARWLQQHQRDSYGHVADEIAIDEINLGGLVGLRVGQPHPMMMGPRYTSTAITSVSHAD